MLQLAQPTMDFKFVRNPKRTCSTRNGGFVCVCLFVSVCVRVCWICFMVPPNGKVVTSLQA
jgi:hypothetical protein